MAAASKKIWSCQGKKVVKEIRGGLPEQYSNKGFCWSFIGLFIVCVFFGILLCREGTGILRDCYRNRVYVFGCVVYLFEIFSIICYR